MHVEPSVILDIWFVELIDLNPEKIRPADTDRYRKRPSFATWNSFTSANRSDWKAFSHPGKALNRRKLFRIATADLIFA